jgi:hypothetical protein
MSASKVKPGVVEELRKRRDSSALKFEAIARGYGAILSEIGARFPDLEYVRELVRQINVTMLPAAVEAQAAYDEYVPHRGMRPRRRTVGRKVKVAK